MVRSTDRLRYGPESRLPLVTPDGGTARTMVQIDAGKSAFNVVAHVGAGLDGLIINGHWVSGYGNIYHHVDLNITPWVRFGQENELIAVFHDKIPIQDAWLDYFARDAYP